MNNKFTDLILRRRTTRSFRSDALENEKVRLILEAGLWAPSAHNRQPWHFTVVEDAALINELNLDAKEASKDSDDKLYHGWANNEKYDSFYGAPLIIVLSYSDKGFSPVEDLAAASQNMLLAAESLGLGSCWNGFVAVVFREKDKMLKYSKKLQIPKGYKPHHAIALGYADGNPRKPPERTGSYNFI